MRAKTVGLPLVYPGSAIVKRKPVRWRPHGTNKFLDDQLTIVERGPESVAERVPHLAAIVNRPRRRRRNMTGNPAGKRELHEQLLQPGVVLSDVRINLAIAAFKVQVHVDEVMARSREAPADVIAIAVNWYERCLSICAGPSAEFRKAA